MHPPATASPSSPPVRRTPVAEELDPAGLWVFESRHAEVFTMAPSRHPFIELLLITGGEATIEGDMTIPICKTGDMVVIPRGLRHRIVDHPRRPLSLYGLGIAVKLLRCVPDVTAQLPGGLVTADRLGPLGLEQRMRRLLYVHGRAGSLNRLAAVAAALDIVAQVSLAAADRPASAPARGDIPDTAPAAGSRDAPSPKAQGSPPAAEPSADHDPLLEAYLVWLERNFFETQTLDSAAAACGMSRRAFTGAFRRRTGRTWLDYLNRLRAAHAVTLLEGTDRKMTSIAFQCGFEDLSTFYRVMHRVTGNRPGGLRSGAKRNAT